MTSKSGGATRPPEEAGRSFNIYRCALICLGAILARSLSSRLSLQDTSLLPSPSRPLRRPHPVVPQRAPPPARYRTRSATRRPRDENLIALLVLSRATTLHSFYRRPLSHDAHRPSLHPLSAGRCPPSRDVVVRHRRLPLPRLVRFPVLCALEHRHAGPGHHQCQRHLPAGYVPSLALTDEDPELAPGTGN